MDSFLHKIEASIPAGIKRQRIGVALSGGADSTAWLLSLRELGLDLIALHCNFHLRGDESDRDEQFCRQLCERLGVELLTINFDVEGYRRDAQRPTSVEMACRELRYQWFESVRSHLGLAVIAVAHNSDDNIETLLLNLMRGTGISGLTGMSALSDNYILRPMLGCSRKEIEEYLATRHQDFVTDSTNLASDYQRNKIRNELLPLMTALFPNARRGILTTISALRSSEAIYADKISELREKCSDAEGNLIINTFLELVPPQQRATVLFELYRADGLTTAQAADITRAIADNNVGRRFPLSKYPGVELILTPKSLSLYIPDETDPFEGKRLEEIFEIEQMPVSQFNPDRDSSVAYFNSELPLERLKVRGWRNGDRMAPFGMKGTRLISDIFTDAKLSLPERQGVPLLVLPESEESAEQILWAAGLRASRHFPVDSKAEGATFYRFRLKKR